MPFQFLLYIRGRSHMMSAKYGGSRPNFPPLCTPKFNSCLPPPPFVVTQLKFAEIIVCYTQNLSLWRRNSAFWINLQIWRKLFKKENKEKNVSVICILYTYCCCNGPPTFYINFVIHSSSHVCKYLNKSNSVSYLWTDRTLYFLGFYNWYWYTSIIWKRGVGW